MFTWKVNKEDQISQLGMFLVILQFGYKNELIYFKILRIKRFVLIRNIPLEIVIVEERLKMH